MSKVIAKINNGWNALDPDNCTISSAYLPDSWRKGYYITGMPIGYYLNFTYKED